MPESTVHLIEVRDPNAASVGRKADEVASLAVTSNPAADRLVTLAQEINACHLQCQGSAQTTLEYAIATGERLIGAKELLKERGDKWNPWVAANCSFEVRQAQKYMRLAKNKKRFLENAPSGSLSGINAALEMIAQPRFEEKDTDGEAGDAFPHDRANTDPASDFDVPAIAEASNDGGGQELGYGQDAPVSAVSHGEDFIAVNASVAASEDLQSSPVLPINSAVSATMDEQEGMMPGVVEPGSPMDDLRRERSETLIELFKNTTSIVTQFINQLISEDWRQAPPETHISLRIELDRLIAAASQAKESLHMNN